MPGQCEVLLASPWIPAEWVKAHGLQPRAHLCASQFRTSVAPLGAGICAFAQDTLTAAERPDAPAFVFTTHCDQLRRAFDSLSPAVQRRCFLFNLPVTVGSTIVQDIFRDELGRLGKFLGGLGGQTPDPMELRAQIERYDACRARLRDNARWQTGRNYAQALARFHSEGPTGTDAVDPAPTLAKAIRLAVVGGPLTHDDLIWRQLESAGAEVVLNGTEWGERGLGQPTGRHPPACNDRRSLFLDGLAASFSEGCVDVFQRPNRRLYEWLESRLVERKAQGIILWHFFGCDLWRAEAQTLRERFGLPLLLLEADASGSGAERNANRIQAFVEALRGNSCGVRDSHFGVRILP